MMERKKFIGGIKDISLLYELALAIGTSLDLEKNCHVFLKILISRKDLGFVSCWIKNEYLVDKEDKDYATLIYAHPKFHIKDTAIPVNHPIFNVPVDKGFFSISSSDDNFSDFITEKGIEKGNLAIFALKDFGVIKLYSMTKKTPFEEKELNQLKKVIFKFATSIQNCLSHQETIKKISERKQAEERLKLYQFMVESAQDAIFFKNLESRYIIANKVALQAFGLSREEVIGKNDYELMPDPEEAKINVEDDQQVFKTGKIREITKHMKDVTGKMRWFQAIKVPQYDDKGQIMGLVGIARDITERKMMEEELQKHRDHLEELVKKKTDELKATKDKLIQSEKLAIASQIASEAAHEIKNPLTVITAGLYYLKQILPKEKENVQNTLLQMKNATKRVSAYINDLLNFSRPPVLQLRQVEINEVLEEVIREMPQEILSDIEIIKDFETDLPQINADSDRLKQVFTNLIKNASEAMQEVRNKKLEVRSEKEEGMVKITISDTGEGIVKEKIGYIFDPFFTTKGKGTGLGLAICQRFIEGHRGKIEVESKVGEGTTFVLKFPISLDRI